MPDQVGHDIFDILHELDGGHGRPGELRPVGTARPALAQGLFKIRTVRINAD